MDEIDAKATAISKWAVTLPSYKKTFLYLFALTFIAGFLLRVVLISHAPTLSRLSDALLYGGAEGVFFLGVPALLASVLAASLARKEDFAHRLKHFSSISLFSALVASVVYLLGLLIAPGIAELPSFVLLANSLVFVTWFIVLFVMLNYGPKAVLMAAFHPVLNISFLTIWSSFLLSGASDPSVLVVKFALSSLVLLFALASIFYILNAPAKRNFGISTLQTATLFFAQLVYGRKDIENIFSEMGETAETFLSTLSFKRKDGSFKAVFLVPHLHFGPFGNVGGSEFPALISKQVQEALSAPAFVFHGTANHDLNPIYSFAASRIANEFIQSAQSLPAKSYSDKAALLTGAHHSAKTAGFAFDNKTAFLALTRAPSTTDDISLPLGISLSEKLKGRGFSDVTLLDMHNSMGEESKMSDGSPEYFEFYDLFAKLSVPTRFEKFRLGVAHDAFSDFSTFEGLGKAGLNVAVFQIGAKTACLVLIDANNIVPSFRRHLLLRILSKHRFDVCDILTTDTHSVNNLSSVHNPLGPRVDFERMAARIERTVDAAVADLEPCRAALSNKRTSLEVLGSGRTSELLTTVSALVAIAKIFAPLIFLLSLALALTLIHW